jgi:hypothetical protein
MNTIKISTSQHIDIDFEIAGLAERIWARLIDLEYLLFFLLIAIQIYLDIVQETIISLIIFVIITTLYP